MLSMFVAIVLLVVCPYFSKANVSPKEKFYKHLVEIVNSSPSPKGTPFPNFIPSPKCLNDRIGIVGAGPAGIHMAYLLKKKGFNNVIVLEKSKRIGGKSYSVKYRNVVHEMGTCYSQPDYKDNVVALAKEFGLWKPVDIPSSNIWLNGHSAPMLYKQYVIRCIMSILQTKDTVIATKALFSATLKYARLHRELFGKYEGELMWKPAPATMNILRCTFYEFLQKYNLTVLKPIFIASHTVQGYGHLDEISALYGLMWNTPNFLNGLARKIVGIDHKLTMLRGGFQNLWETVKITNNLDIRFNTTVEEIVRRAYHVFVKTSSPSATIKFDFLIWTPSLYSNINNVHPSKTERKMFSKLHPVWFTTTIFDSTYGTRGPSPIDYWIDNIENKVEHAVWAQRDSYGVLNGQYGPEYQSGSLPGGPDGTFIRSGVAYQYGKQPMTADSIKTIFKKHFKQTQADQITAQQSVTWEYFPRFSPDDMAAGALWDIFEMQGTRRTWFAGSSVSFESVKSVLEYNKLLVSKMTAAYDHC